MVPKTMVISVAILGATGVVGQKAIALLQDDARFGPRFRIAECVASDRHIGRRFGDVCHWREPLMPLPRAVADITLCAAEEVTSDFILSCVPADVAVHAEPMLRAKGKIVFSNASAFRMDPQVPLLVPEINAAHLSLLAMQPFSGKIITNPNCSAVGVTLALAPLMALGAIRHVSVVTLQSISGAGYPGIPSLDVLGNTIPHIHGEAEKIVEETQRILGTAETKASFSVTAQVHRVPVAFGHSVTLHVTFDASVTPAQAVESYHLWNEKHPELFLIHPRDGHPQPLRDLTQDDMRIHIGHLRQGGQENILNLVALSHNLVRGAAGAILRNMEQYLQCEFAV